MSSKKVASKDSKSKKAPAKAPAKSAAKPAAKAAAKAPAKKPAEKPAKKAAPAAKKPAPAPVKKAPAKSAAKPAPKAEAKKPVTKESPKASNAKKAPAAKPVAAEKKVAKSTAKPVAAKPVEKVAAKPKAAEKIEKAAPVAKKSTPAPEKAPVKEEAKKKPAPVEVAKVQEEPAAAPVVAEDKGDVKKKNAPDYAYAVLLQGVKRLSKTIMFVKVDESEDRSNKKTMSSDVKNLDMKPTSPIRHKASLAEETQEELTERILKELEEQNRLFERVETILEGLVVHNGQDATIKGRAAHKPHDFGEFRFEEVGNDVDVSIYVEGRTQVSTFERLTGRRFGGKGDNVVEIADGRVDIVGGVAGTICGESFGVEREICGRVRRERAAGRGDATKRSS